MFQKFKSSTQGLRVAGLKNRESRIENGGWRRSAIFYLRSSIFVLLIPLTLEPVFAQDLKALEEGAKKEGKLNLLWIDPRGRG